MQFVKTFFTAIIFYCYFIPLQAQQSVGIGTTNPQAKLHVKGTGGGTQIILEENAGSVLRISNEANAAGPYIGTSSNHSFSLVSNNAVRMVVATNGNVGIGNSNPQALLDINMGGGRSFRIKNELVPALEIASTNNNDALAGILRFRNALEIMPSSDGTRAGKLDVRNSEGNATISLDGSNGVISAANAAAFGFKRNFMGVSAFAGNNYDRTLCEITVNVPAGGVLYIEGYTDCSFRWNQLWSTFGLELKLDEYSSDDNFISTLTKQEYRHLRDFDYPVIFATLVMPTAGIRKIKFNLYKSGNTHSLGGENHAIKVSYFPTVLQVN